MKMRLTDITLPELQFNPDRDRRCHDDRDYLSRDGGQDPKAIL